MAGSRTTGRAERGPDLDLEHDARRVLALAVLADDLNPAALARLAGIGLAGVEAALAAGRDRGLVGPDGLTADGAAALADALDPDEAASAHAAIARRLIADGPDRLDEAIRHARAGSSVEELEGLLDVIDHAARTGLSVSDYASTQRLLELADELDLGAEPLDRARRLCLLAEALDGLGREADAREAAARAFDLAELEGDAATATRAAVLHTLPIGWNAGDPRSASQLQRAEALDPGPADQVAIAAARAIVEIRVPLSLQADVQVAWATRASLAQPLAERALERSLGAPPWHRCIALLAWRTTHRAPQHLKRRREASREALDLAQRLRLPGRQVEAALMLAVDGLESADRPTFDEALGVARWVAERDGNPRLRAHAHALAASAAFMDEDLDTAERHRAVAHRLGQHAGLASRTGTDAVLMAQSLILRGDLGAIVAAVPAEDDPMLAHPLARALAAEARVRRGDAVAAERDLRRALRSLDEETSQLLTWTLAASSAVALGLDDVIDRLVRDLAPWADHVAVDGNGWWCGGPVSFALAELHLATGDTDRAAVLLGRALTTARAMGDVRTLHRIEALVPGSGVEPIDVPAEVPRAAAGSRTAAGRDGGALARLTVRETQVLTLLARGATNPEIARTLSYSLTTVKDDTRAVYRKLGVTGRAEAAALAGELGLV